ncbi:MAG: CheY-like chemotaxis protein [Paraglaciecola sp.]|jgi:CheY-like chemotaxis protein
MEQCLATYYRSLDAVTDYPICEHKIVTLLPRQYEEEAYEAFSSGMIDDYLVARPLYEIHRVLLICQHLLTELGISDCSIKVSAGFIKQSEKYAPDIQTSIAKHLLHKGNMRIAFEKSMIDIDIALDQAAKRIQQNQSVSLNMAKLKQTLAAIRSDEIRPELLQLQQKAMDLLAQAVVNKSDLEEEPGEDKAISEVDVSQDISQVNKIPQQNYVFNRLYQQQASPHTLSKEQSQVPSVLVVEDEVISIELTRRLLESYNLKVDLVSSGRQAFAALTSQRYALVLLDISLPDTNGIYIVDQVSRGKGPNSQTPIIMLTSNKNTVSQAIERGAKGYIIKPLYKSSLKKIFERYKIPLHLKGH